MSVQICRSKIRKYFCHNHNCISAIQMEDMHDTFQLIIMQLLENFANSSNFMIYWNWLFLIQDLYFAVTYSIRIEYVIRGLIIIFLSHKKTFGVIIKHQKKMLSHYLLLFCDLLIQNLSTRHCFEVEKH